MVDPRSAIKMDVRLVYNLKKVVPEAGAKSMVESLSAIKMDVLLV